MKIVLTGGGSGGHFYPLIAVAEEIRDYAHENQIISPKLYYVAGSEFDKNALFENEIKFKKISTGKLRRNLSPLNILRNIADMFSVLFGFLQSLIFLFTTYPDVIFSKGGYHSVPVVLAGWLLRIPIVIHESDSKPGRATLIGAKFATRISITFESSAAFFPDKVQAKIAHTGTPIRKSLHKISADGIEEIANYDKRLPTVLVVGGSLGAVAVNSAVIDALPQLLTKCQVIHQTGQANIEDVEAISKVVLENSPYKERYHPFAYLSPLSMRRSAGAASVIVSRAGSTAISEFSVWGKPSILIPIPEKVSHDQMTNAYEYAKYGGTKIIEQSNLTPHLLTNEILSIVNDPALQQEMSESAKGFANKEAGAIIARELIEIAQSHNG